MAKTGLANNTKKKIYVLFKLGVCLFQRKKGQENKMDKVVLEKVGRLKWQRQGWLIIQKRKFTFYLS